jgi:hypothetical protein
LVGEGIILPSFVGVALNVVGDGLGMRVLAGIKATYSTGLKAPGTSSEREQLLAFLFIASAGLSAPCKQLF